MRKPLLTKNVKNSQNVPVWQMTQVRSKKEVIKEAQKAERTVQFAPLMDICHLKKKSELKPRFQKYKGRVVLRVGTVKYDSGSCAICTEQGSAASITNDGRKSSGWCSTAVSMRRTSSRCSISLYPGQNGGCFSIVELPKSECPDIWTRLPPHKVQIMVQFGRPSRSS